MSYGVCVIDPLQVPPGRTLGDVWDDELYQAASKVDADRSARKWQLRDALMAFNPRLVFHEPSPPPGAIAQFLSGSVVPERSLTLEFPVAEDEGIDFTIYDDAVEIELPYDATREDARYYMTELWRHLKQFEAMGFSATYDIERETVLALDTDFDVALERYFANLAELRDEVADAPAVSQTPQPELAPAQGDANVDGQLRPRPSATLSTASPAPSVEPTPSLDEPFTGNVAAPRPWWKFW